MSFITRFFGWGGNATQQRDGAQDTQPNAAAHDLTPNIGIDAALQVSTVWACVTLLVENIASLPLNVFTTDENGRRNTDKLSRIYQILHDRPNSRQTAMEFWMHMLLNYVLRGNAYARIERDAKGEVLSLWPLSADQIEVAVAKDGTLLYAYSYGSTKIVYTEAQILHIRGMGNGVVGMSPLDYMRSSVGLSIAAQNHTNKTYSKEARRPGVLMSDAVLTPPQREAVKKNFGDIATGNGRELYVLEAQFKFEPLGMTPADIQLLETRRFSVQDLARWFGVPSVLVNDSSDTTTWGSGVQQIVDGFHKLKLRPMLELIEQAVMQRVFTPRQRAQGLACEFNLDALLRSSLSERMTVYSTATQNGIYTRNECRRKENLEPVAGGDQLTAQSNLLPLDKLGQQLNNAGSVPADPVRQ
jgi:HK97 family phage portal protein